MRGGKKYIFTAFLTIVRVVTVGALLKIITFVTEQWLKYLNIFCGS